MRSDESLEKRVEELFSSVCRLESYMIRLLMDDAMQDIRECFGQIIFGCSCL